MTRDQIQRKKLQFKRSSSTAPWREKQKPYKKFPHFQENMGTKHCYGLDRTYDDDGDDDNNTMLHLDTAGDGDDDGDSDGDDDDSDDHDYDDDDGDDGGVMMVVIMLHLDTAGEKNQKTSCNAFSCQRSPERECPENPKTSF